MTIFDLLFIAAFLASVAALSIAAVYLLRGRRGTAFRVLRVWGIGAGGYVMIAIAVAYFKPQRVINPGKPWCFDDWCLTVANVERTQNASGFSYKVDIRISSRARRVAQRARGAWVYLIDNRGQRYSPASDAAAAPLDILLQPEESVSTSRAFQVPAGVQHLGLITGHGGPYCGPMDLLIIGGDGCLFNKPTMIRIQ